MDFHIFTIENENSYDQSAFVQKIDEREMVVFVNSVNGNVSSLTLKKHFLQINYLEIVRRIFTFKKNIDKNCHLNF